MNTYVLIARHLGKVSGEKIYSYNKLEYMASLGWRVLFLSGKDESGFRDKEAKYLHFVFPALTYAPECYSKREVARTIDGIAACIGDYGDDQCIIESDSVPRALWAELIAKRVGARHFAFLLQERHHYDEEIRRFLRFKYDRHELAGITVPSINLILGDDSAERRDDTRIRAYCNNAVKECDDLFSSRLFKDANYTFGSIGRLDKDCVLPIIRAFKAYAADRADQQFNVVLIGGALNKKRIQQIRKEMDKAPNIHLLITGYLYPVPASLLRNIDVFASAAGSSTVSYRYHRPTIRVHPLTGEPSGILGLDDMEGKTIYDTIPGVTLGECIERAIMNADKIQYAYNYYEDYYEIMSKEFDRQLAFMSIPRPKEYYDEERLMRIKTTRIKGHFFHWIVGHIFGANGLNGLIRLLKLLHLR